MSASRTLTGSLDHAGVVMGEWARGEEPAGEEEEKCCSGEASRSGDADPGAAKEETAG